MRAPQYGQTRWQAKRRTNNAALPTDAPAKGYIRPCGFAHSRTLAFELPGRSTGVPYGHSPVALYGPVSGMRFRHKKHTKLTLSLWNAAPDIWGNPRDPWAGKYKGSRKTRQLVKTLKRAYRAKHGSLAGPIMTKKQLRLTEVKAD